MSSHHTPDHPRYCSPERWAEIKRLKPSPGRPVSEGYVTFKRARKRNREWQAAQSRA